MSRFRDITEIEREKHSPAPSAEMERDAAEGSAVEFLRPPLVSGEVLDAFIGMRDSIRGTAKQKPVRMIGVTSSQQQEGKTRTAVCLAITFAMDPRLRVLLVDGNLRAPGVAPLLHLPHSPGLADLVLEDLPLSAAVQGLRDFPLGVLTSGATKLTPGEVYSLPRFARRMAELRETFDVTVVDTSAVKKYPDFEILSKHLDGALLVLEADKTQLTMIQETKARIEAAGVPILGVVLNRVKNPIPAALNRKFGLD